MLAHSKLVIPASVSLSKLVIPTFFPYLPPPFASVLLCRTFPACVPPLLTSMTTTMTSDSASPHTPSEYGTLMMTSSTSLTGSTSTLCTIVFSFAADASTLCHIESVINLLLVISSSNNEKHDYHAHQNSFVSLSSLVCPRTSNPLAEFLVLLHQLVSSSLFLPW